MTSRKKETRSVYLAFEFERDASRRTGFIADACKRSEFALVDRSLPAAQHSARWRQEALARIQDSHVVIVLLGQDTQNAPGVEDELSLAGQARCPVVQLMPQHQNYGLVSENGAVCLYQWTRVDAMLRDPRSFVNNPANRGKQSLSR